MGTPPAGFTANPAIDKLDLAPAACRGAYLLKQVFPAVVFTSGKRGVADQARAMASNVVHNRLWIEQTYKYSPLRVRCQDWVNANPGKTSATDIAKGLLAVLQAAPPAELAAFSLHLAGMAFDVQPMSQNAAAVKAKIHSLPGCTQFLDHEGGLVRWHAEFREA